MQRFTAMITAAAHAHFPGTVVTTGSASLKWASPRGSSYGPDQWHQHPGAEADWWSDEALEAAYPEGA